MGETIQTSKGPIAFPDGMSDDAIIAAIKQIEGQYEMPIPKNVNPYGVGGGNYQNQPEFKEGVNQGMQQSTEAMARYGLPAAAMAATAPISVPYSAAVGAASAVLGNKFTQNSRINRGAQEEFDEGQLASDVILNATPFVNAGKLLPKVATNIASSVASQEAASLARGEGHIGGGEVAITSLLTGTLSGLGRAGGGVRNKAAQAETIRKARDGGSVALSEVFPSLRELEARVVGADEFATAIIRDMDSGTATKLFRQFGGVAEDPKVAKELSGLVKALTPLQKRVEDANKALVRAKDGYSKAMATQSAAMPEFKRKAEQAAFDVATAEYARQGMVRSMFKDILPDVGKVAEGARRTRLTKIAGAARDSAKGGMDQLWKATGLGINSKQVMRDDLLTAIKNIRKGPLAGKDAKAAFAEAADATFGNKASFTRERYMDFRDRFANKLVEEGGDPDRANAIAAEAYKVVKKSADRYVKGNLSSQQQDAWTNFNKLSASYYSAKGTDVMDIIAKGDADELINKLSEGEGINLGQLKKYTKSIRDVGGDDAANLFRDDVNALIRDGLIDSAVIRGTGARGLEAIDSKKLISAVDALDSRNFPVQSLGLGSKSQIRQLAQLAEGGQYNRQELNQIFANLNKVGISKAKGRLDYFKELRKTLISNGGARAVKTNSRLIKARNDAKLSVADADEVLKKAKADPMIEMLSETGLKLSKDPVNNIGWASKLTGTDRETTSAFARAMTKSGRTKELQQTKEAAVAATMMSFFKDEVGQGAAIHVEKMNTFFNAVEGKRGRDALRGLIGNEEYANLKRAFMQPVEKIASTRIDLDRVNPSVLDSLGGTARAPAPGGITGYVPLGPIRQALANKRYKTLYKLMVDPVTSKKWAKAGGDMEKFIAASPVNSAIMRILGQQEDELEAERR